MATASRQQRLARTAGNKTPSPSPRSRIFSFDRYLARHCEYRRIPHGARSLLGDTSRTRYWPFRFPCHTDPWIKHQEVRPPVNDVASFDPHLGSRARVFGLQRVTFKVQPFMKMSLGFAYTKSWLVSNSRQLQVWLSELLSSERFSPVACMHELVCLRRTAYYAFL